jgi:hypothetical protein
MIARSNILMSGLGVAVFLTGLVSSALAQGVGVAGGAGPGAGGSAFGGELRGPTIIEGRVICARCTLDDVRATQPDLTDLYEFHHDDGALVIQILPHYNIDPLAYNVWWQSDGAIRWMSLVGLNKSVSVRTPSYLYRQLMAEENLLRPVQLNGLLRRTRTYDVVSVDYLAPIPSPLAAARQAQEAARRAQAAAERAEAAAGRTQGAAERAENAADRLMAMTNTAENQFTANLMK